VRGVGGTAALLATHTDKPPINKSPTEMERIILIVIEPIHGTIR
jgi:hypothetical protein